jgi:hypothetical protein
MEELAKELLSFLEESFSRDFESEEQRRAYRLQRTTTFLEMKFGNVQELEKEVEILRKWRESMMPVVLSAIPEPPRKSPFDWRERDEA